MWEPWHQLVLNTNEENTVILPYLNVVYLNLVNLSYLKIGTGNPCAGQRRAKLCFAERKNKLLLSSVENVGPLAPTGSVEFK